MKVLENNVKPFAPRYHFRCPDCHSKFEASLEELQALPNGRYREPLHGKFVIVVACPVCATERVYASDMQNAAQYDAVVEVVEDESFLRKAHRFVFPYKYRGQK